jgi:hypothetical protein
MKMHMEERWLHPWRGRGLLEPPRRRRSNHHGVERGVTATTMEKKRCAVEC